MAAHELDPGEVDQSMLAGVTQFVHRNAVQLPRLSNRKTMIDHPLLTRVVFDVWSEI